MSKYQSLRNYLSQLDKSSWKASFADIEKILGFSLPKSAHNHQAWWSLFENTAILTCGDVEIEKLNRAK